MEFNGHAAAASLGGDIMVSGYLKTDCSDPSPWNEEGLPSAFLSSLPPPPPFLSHPPLTSPSFALLFHTYLLFFNSFIFSPFFATFCGKTMPTFPCQLFYQRLTKPSGRRPNKPPKKQKTGGNEIQMKQQKQAQHNSVICIPCRVNGQKSS